MYRRFREFEHCSLPLPPPPLFRLIIFLDGPVLGWGLGVGFESGLDKVHDQDQAHGALLRGGSA